VKASKERFHEQHITLRATVSRRSRRKPGDHGRRLVVVVPVHTFVFADLVGFTAFTLRHGDEPAAELAVAFADRTRTLAAEYGASLVKAMGDAAMLHCLDAAAGLQLAVRIRSEFGAKPDLPGVRVGVHSGPAVERDGDWFGASVNLAARLAGAAAPGEVIVSEPTHLAAGRLGRRDMRRRRTPRLKHVLEPPDLYAVAGSALEPAPAASA
jgi:adenylate cyclase